MPSQRPLGGEGVEAVASPASASARIRSYVSRPPSGERPALRNRAWSRTSVSSSRATHSGTAAIGLTGCDPLAAVACGADQRLSVDDHSAAHADGAPDQHHSVDARARRGDVPRGRRGPPRSRRHRHVHVQRVDQRIASASSRQPRFGATEPCPSLRRTTPPRRRRSPRGCRLTGAITQRHPSSARAVAMSPTFRPTARKVDADQIEDLTTQADRGGGAANRPRPQAPGRPPMGIGPDERRWPPRCPVQGGRTLEREPARDELTDEPADRATGSARCARRGPSATGAAVVQLADDRAQIPRLRSRCGVRARPDR